MIGYATAPLRCPLFLGLISTIRDPFFFPPSIATVKLNKKYFIGWVWERERERERFCGPFFGLISTFETLFFPFHRNRKVRNISLVGHGRERDRERDFVGRGEF